MKHATKAYCLALFACLIWAGNFVIARMAEASIGPVTMAFWRWVVAFFVLLPFSWREVVKHWDSIIERKRYFILMGMLGIGTFNALIYWAAHFTTSHHIALICATSPIWTLVAAALIRIEPITLFKSFGALMAFVGAAVVITHGDLASLTTQSYNFGDCLLLICALLWGGWNILLRYKPKALPSLAFLTAVIGIGLVFLLPIYLLEAFLYQPTPYDIQAIGIYLYTGIFASVIGWLCWQFAIDTVGPFKTSLMYYSIPLFTGLLGSVFLHEAVALYHVVGFACVCAGVWVSSLSR